MREWRTVEMFAWRSARTGVGVDMRLPPGGWMSTWLTHAPEAENSDKLPKEYPGGRQLRPSLPAGSRGLNDDVVHDRADPWRKLRGNAGRLLLLGRMDKSPQIAPGGGRLCGGV